MVAAAIARAHPGRFIVITTDSVPESERWLADLGALVDDPSTIALYPPREGLGEAEPHAEVAGERVETLERMSRGVVQVLLTTARALLERTRLPRAVAASRLELRRGDRWRLGDLVAHLESVGYQRVTMVEDVAQFSVRGGILDVYGFGMTDPVRAELWGTRSPNCATSTSTRSVRRGRPTSRWCSRWRPRPAMTRRASSG